MTRDELVERMAETIHKRAIVVYSDATGAILRNGNDIAEAAIADVEAAGWGPSNAWNGDTSHPAYQRGMNDATEAMIAAGWGPKPEPVTDYERAIMARKAYQGWQAEPKIYPTEGDTQDWLRVVDAVLASPVLESRGIRVDGQG